MLRTVTATRYVTALKEGGSLPGLVEADDCGLYVVKMRAAGQGTKALVAEIIVGELARTFGLPVPEIVLVEISDQLGRTEPDPEINELVTGSAGINVGIDFLPGSLDYSAARPELIDPELASRVVVFDAYTTNVDRTPRNPNMLVWHRNPWLIDHGAALYQHHGSPDLVIRAGDVFPQIADHVLLPLASDLDGAENELVARLTSEEITRAVELVPDTLLGADPGADRAMYIAYLTQRLHGSRPFAAEAARARAALIGDADAS